MYMQKIALLVAARFFFSGLHKKNGVTEVTPFAIAGD